MSLMKKLSNMTKEDLKEISSLKPGQSETLYWLKYTTKEDYITKSFYDKMVKDIEKNFNYEQHDVDTKKINFEYYDEKKGIPVLFSYEFETEGYDEEEDDIIGKASLTDLSDMYEDAEKDMEDWMKIQEQHDETEEEFEERIRQMKEGKNKMSLMKKMASIIKRDQMKLASVDYSETYKAEYLNEDGTPDYKEILNALLGEAKVVKQSEETEKHYSDDSVGHFFSGSVTTGKIQLEVPLSVVIVNNYVDELDGLHSYIQQEEVEKAIEEDMKEYVDCEGELEKFSASCDLDVTNNVVLFKVEYTCVQKEEE